MRLGWGSGVETCDNKIRGDGDGWKGGEREVKRRGDACGEREMSVSSQYDSIKQDLTRLPCFYTPSRFQAPLCSVRCLSLPLSLFLSLTVLFDVSPTLYLSLSVFGSHSLSSTHGDGDGCVDRSQSRGTCQHSVFRSVPASTFCFSECSNLNVLFF